MRQTISNSGVTRKYSSNRLASPAGIRLLANHKIAAVGSATSQKAIKICTRILAVSNSQIGDAYWQVFAVRLSSVQRPLKRAGAPSHISCEPTLVRMGVNGVIQLPRPIVTLLAMAARIPILHLLSM